jgi:hypothetical protein
MEPIQKRMGLFIKQRSPIYNEVRRSAALWGIVRLGFVILGKEGEKGCLFLIIC